MAVPERTCSQGTTFDPAVGQCVLVCNCGPGLQKDPTTGMCQLPPPGTVLATASFGPMYQHVYYADTTTTPVSYKQIGGATAVTAMIGGGPAPGSTPLFLKNGTPMGGFIAPLVPSGMPITEPSAFPSTKQLVLGEHQACQAQITIYKPFDYNATTNNRFLVVLDASGCSANTLYSLWLYISPGTKADLAAAFVARTLIAPAGGLPSLLVTDDAGAAHWQRTLDAAAYFKRGGGVGGYTPLVPGNTFPSTGGLILPVLVRHGGGTSNGNAGLCPLKADGTCATMPSDIAVTPPFPRYQAVFGDLGVDAQLTNMAAIDLDPVQPGP
jgi:hypothetical protein